MKHAPSLSAPARRGDLLLSVTNWAIVALILIAPLAMGGRHGVGKIVFSGLIFLAACSWMWRRCIRPCARWKATGAEWIVAAGLALMTLQLVPLPASWLARLSPAIGSRLTLWSGSTPSDLGLDTWSQLSLHPMATRYAIATFAGYAMLFLVLAQHVRTLEQIEGLLRWIAVAVIAMAGLGLAQLVFGNGKFLWVYAHPTRETVGVVRGPFANQNHMAHFLALGVAPLIWWISRGGSLFPSKSDRSEKLAAPPVDGRRLETRTLVLAASVGIVLLAGLLTFSRAGLCAILLAGAGGGLALAWAGKLNRRVGVMAATLAVFAALGLAVFGLAPLAERWGRLAGARTLGDLSAGRQMVWGAVRQAIADFPLVGTGAGTHADVYPMYLSQYTPVQYTHAESGYLQVLEELGVAGLALLLMGMVTAANWCRRSLWLADSSRQRTLAIAITASLLVSALHAVVDFVWYIPACMTVTVIQLACAWRLSQLADPRPAAEDAVKWRRPVAVGAAMVVTVAALTVLLLEWGPARAASHWDQFVRLSNEPGANSAIVASPADGGTSGRDQADAMEDQVIRLSDSLERALRANPRDARAHCRLAGVELQRFDLAQRHAQNHMSLVQIRDAALLSNFPTLQAQDQWLARAVPENGRLLRSALRHARRAAQLSPLQGEAYVYLAQLGFLVGEGARTKMACLRQALCVRPHNDAVLMAAGSELALAGNIRQATKFWSRVFHHSPVFQEQIIQLFAPHVPAQVFLETFQPDLRGAERLFAFYRKTGLVPHAQVAGRYYLERLQQRHDHAQTFGSEDWYRMFVVHDYLGSEQEAEQCLRQAVASAPRNFAMHRKLGRYLLERKQFAEASEQLKWCLRRKPQDTALRRDLIVATRQTVMTR